MNKISSRLGGIVLLLLLALAVRPSIAAEVWADDFEDGSHDDWTLNSCAVIDGTLKSTGSAYHESTR